MPTDIEDTPWPVSDYLNLAHAYFCAYCELKPRVLFDWPRYLLLGHSAEVGLKAFSIFRGVPIKTLEKKPYGHNLEKLLTEAENKGLPVTPRQRRDIQLLNRVHGFPYAARYPDYGDADRQSVPAGGVAVSEGLAPSVAQILNSIHERVPVALTVAPYRGNGRHSTPLPIHAGSCSDALLRSHFRQRADRRSTSLEVPRPHRMMNGAISVKRRKGRWVLKRRGEKPLAVSDTGVVELDGAPVRPSMATTQTV